MNKALIYPTTLLFALSLHAAPSIAVMETALGNRAKLESIYQAKEAGYSGVQLHTGVLDDKGVLTMADPKLIQSFLAASKAHGIEIVSLCAGSMNGTPAWEAESRAQAIAIGKQSIDACVAMDVPILLIPFFGKAAFGNDVESAEIKAATGVIRELTRYAAKYDVVLGLECNSLKPAIDHILKEVDSPHLKVYYDTGNQLRVGEDVYSVIEDWGPKNLICQLHLKHHGSKYAIFGQGETDLPRLARIIRDSGYDGWFVFEAGRGERTLGIPYAKENLKGIHRMFATLDR